METSNETSRKRSSKTVAVIFVIVGLLGFLDSAYLTIGHYRHTLPPCSVVAGCDEVLTSRYSTVIGVPVALGGALFYLFIFLSGGLYLDTKRETLLRLAARLTVVGLLASLYFLGVQMFILHAYCLYCLGSLATATTLFIAGRFLPKTIIGEPVA